MEAKFPSIAPDCILCKHYEVTWDTSFPRGCKLFGVKCRNQPSMEVFLSTGKHCFAFEVKEVLNKADSDSDDGIWA